MKYLRKFNEHSGYTAFSQSEGFIKPNVSYCVNENDVHYTNNKPNFSLRMKFKYRYENTSYPLIAFGNDVERLWLNDTELYRTVDGWGENSEISCFSTGGEPNCNVLSYMTKEANEIVDLKVETSNKTQITSEDFGDVLEIEDYGVITEVDIYAFRDKQLSSVTLGENIQVIRIGAFLVDSGVQNLYVTINAATPPQLKNNNDETVGSPDVFQYGITTIYVPSGSLNAYKTAWPELSEFIYSIP